MITYCSNCGHKADNATDQGFKCVNCGKSTYFNSKPTAAVIPIVGDEMLISVRSGEPKKGQLDPIGGFLNYGEDPVTGVMREAKEETGLILDKDKLKFLGIYIGDYEFEGQNHKILNIYYTYQLDQKPPVTAADDVAELRWLDINSDHHWAFDYLHQVMADLKSQTTSS